MLADLPRGSLLDAGTGTGRAGAGRHAAGLRAGVRLRQRPRGARDRRRERAPQRPAAAAVRGRRHRRRRSSCPQADIVVANIALDADHRPSARATRRARAAGAGAPAHRRARRPARRAGGAGAGRLRRLPPAARRREGEWAASCSSAAPRSARRAAGEVAAVAERPRRARRDAPLRVHAAFAGCKVSQADSEAVLASLARARLPAGRATPPRPTSQVVLTCGVTGEAERSSRQLARRLAAHGRPVVVAGCAAALRPEQFAERRRRRWRRRRAAGRPGPRPWRRRVLEARRPDGCACRATPPRPAPPTTPCAAAMPAADAAARAGRTRFTLKVQDGCAGRCTYCAVRLVRGRPWSLAADDAVARARAALAAGCGEIVLSGIDVGAWRDRRAAPAWPALVGAARPAARARPPAAVVDRAAPPDGGAARGARRPAGGPPPARAAAVGRRRRAARPWAGRTRGASTARRVGRRAPPPARAGPVDRPDRRVSDRRRGGLRALAGRHRAGRRALRPRARVRVLAAAGHAGGGAGAAAGRRWSRRGRALAREAAAAAQRAAAAASLAARPESWSRSTATAAWRGYSSTYVRYYLSGAAPPAAAWSRPWPDAATRDGVRGRDRRT